MGYVGQKFGVLLSGGLQLGESVFVSFPGLSASVDAIHCNRHRAKHNHGAQAKTHHIFDTHIRINGM